MPLKKRHSGHSSSRDGQAKKKKLGNKNHNQPGTCVCVSECVTVVRVALKRTLLYLRAPLTAAEAALKELAKKLTGGWVLGQKKVCFNSFSIEHKKMFSYLYNVNIL